MKKIIWLIILIALLFSGVFFYLQYQIYSSVGDNQGQEIEITKGQGAKEVGVLLEERGIINDNLFFNFYVLKHNLTDKILPGNYFIASGMTIPEIAQLIIKEQSRDIKITFPEGWTIKQMSERLTEKNLPGEEFLKLAEDGELFSEQYSFLQNREVSSLEGYLFPDTYFFLPDASAKDIIKKMLDNFESRIDSQLKEEIVKQKKTLEEIIIMASVIEKEVNKDEDRKIVSGIFWNRLSVGQALQSCATISYILGENKKQYSFEETRIVSPYNTYINPGLPVGAINNPGLSAILAAISPEDSSYVYFLNDPKTGKTIFSRTLDEHNNNKVKYGL